MKKENERLFIFFQKPVVLPVKKPVPSPRKKDVEVRTYSNGVFTGYIPMEGGVLH